MASICKRGATMMKSSLIRTNLIFILLVLFIPNLVSATDAENSNLKNKNSRLEKYVSDKLKQDAESSPEKSWANAIL